ncbi:pyridoxamine 5'-phosphate oxidase family protein [Bacillus subtilis]|uniref:Pyridoxamine 5'-phosphate oxidase family protein n=1 Tax=Bacillus subtilis TaxID=1423 RepID=A0AAQ3ID54_BACIU|nr:pyridoxamine 5'-phosphate oxidase family protein [Bacillus subtilis]ODV44771.1 pyridoxamine 5'-phosphate oxidase [Bacillus subtilis]OJH64742.1 pyridoxamine 5'-phosphate oxidase [Bacillus subtilis]QAR60341.1 pyridoxamine 5'-phosphate oxidase [Bacillus subtilis]QAW06965.1 pyridoxamine 5'-phosphate oxidase [Bacillus subtilis]QJC14831.1 pyridoxamine 5'-phosphate oxidase [Bacillus subtilis]
MVNYSGEEILREKFNTKGIRVGKFITDLFRQYIESMDFFFIATSNREGKCDCSYRGGWKGSSPAVKVIDEKTLIFPDYRGNGAFQSLGNILENPNIGILFIDFTHAQRLRVNGQAVIVDTPEWKELFPKSLQIVKVTVEEIYPNCSLRIPRMKRVSETNNNL